VQVSNDDRSMVMARDAKTPPVPVPVTDRPILVESPASLPVSEM